MTDRLSVLIGLRVSNFLTLGPFVRQLYEQAMPREETTIVGQRQVRHGEIETSYTNLEPRLAVRLMLSENASVKAGMGRNFQYISLLSNTTAVSPMDTWKLADVYMSPQRSDQMSIGYFRTTGNRQYEWSAESYYKRFSNITQYKEGARLVLNQAIETDLLHGDGQSFGLELHAKKNSGKVTGWLSYTYSRSLAKVSGDHQEETLSNGKYFPSNFDKPHDLSIVLNYALSQRISLSGNFVYNTGRPITYPESIYVVDGYVVAEYASINQARIPDYHRLDLAINHAMLKKKSRKVETSWSLGAYNVYARKNPFSVFFRPSYSGRYPQAYRLSVLGSVIPYFSLNFKIR